MPMPSVKRQVDYHIKASSGCNYKKRFVYKQGVGICLLLPEKGCLTSHKIRYDLSCPFVGAYDIGCVQKGDI